MKKTIVILILLFMSAIPSIAAVSSTGEVNVEGNDTGTVFASSKATLIFSLIIDRSQAEIGEEIKSIHIFFPTGFLVDEQGLQYVKLNGKEIEGTEVISDEYSVRLILPSLITDVNTFAEIAIRFSTPEHDLPQRVLFDVLLRNPNDVIIGDFVKPGNADGRDNNNSFAIAIKPNFPPPPPADFSAIPDKTGENDVTLSWSKSTDLDVQGYYVYRDNQKIAEVPATDQNPVIWKEINVEPGAHRYYVEAFKTELIRSEPSAKVEVKVNPDTAAPLPPREFEIKETETGFEMKWLASASSDTVKYRVLFGSSIASLETIAEIERSTTGDADGYRFFHQPPAGMKAIVFAVEAVDEVGLSSERVLQERQALSEPYPNPFTPLSPNPNFRQITFSAAAIEDTDGDFTVRIFDLHGRLIVSLKDETGEKRLSWDGRRKNGEVAESGIYIYQIQVGSRYKVGTFILAR